VIFRLDERLGPAADFCQRLADRGVKLHPIARTKIRAVTHLDVSAADAAKVAEMLVAVARS
jgi:hypothetical protein